MNTQEIMNVALQLAGMACVPGDSSIYYPGENIRRILFAVDVGAGELFIASERGFDAVVSHHPPRGAALPLWEVYQRHVGLMVEAGVPQDEAQQAVAGTIANMKTAYQAGNHEHFPSLCRLLSIPFMNIHGPLDERGRQIMQAALDESQVETVGEVMEVLGALPEMSCAHSQVSLVAGSPSHRVGKVVVAHGCLTNGGYAVADTYFRHGIDTVVYIHVSHQDGERLAREGRGNLIVSGHIASDLVGINPFLRALSARGLEVVALDGAQSETYQGEK